MLGPKLILACFLFAFLPGGMMAQDIHFFHFSGSGPLLSPAEAGNGLGKFRFSIGHRTQWASVSTPFLARHFSLDSYIPVGKSGLRLGWGLSIQQDQAGDAAFGTTGALLSLNLNVPIQKSDRIILGIGGGMMQRKFDRNQLTYDEQFNGLTFDPDILPMDIPDDGALIFPDFSAGISWLNLEGPKESSTVGLAVHHPHRPELSFYNDNSVQLDLRWSIYTMVTRPLDGPWLIRPEARFMKQGSYNEYLLGAWLTHNYSAAFPEMINVEGGLFTRAGDAAIIAIAGSHSGWRLAMSYEVNYSGLKPASAWRGAWEFNVVYNVGRLAPLLHRNPSCFLL